MKEIGEIVQTQGKQALVRIKRHSACSKCNNKCGLAATTDHESDEIEVEVDNDIGAKKGQVVRLEMGEQPLVMASLLIYVFPLMSLFAGYFIGQYLASILGYTPSEINGIIGSFVTFGLSFAVIRFIDNRLRNRRSFNPKITQILR